MVSLPTILKVCLFLEISTTLMNLILKLYSKAAADWRLLQVIQGNLMNLKKSLWGSLAPAQVLSPPFTHVCSPPLSHHRTFCRSLTGRRCQLQHRGLDIFNPPSSRFLKPLWISPYIPLDCFCFFPATKFFHRNISFLKLSVVSIMIVITYHMSSAVPVIKSRLQQWFSKSLTSSVWPAARVTFNKFPRIIIITTRYCSVDLLPRSSFSTSVAIQVLCPALSSRLLVILLLVIFSALSSACKKVPRSASTPRSHSPHFDWGYFSKTARLQHMLQSLSLFTSNFWNLKKNLFSRHNNLICIKIKIKV